MLHCYNRLSNQQLGVDMSWDGKTPTPLPFGRQLRQVRTISTQNRLEIFDATFLTHPKLQPGLHGPEEGPNALGIKAAKIYGTVEKLDTLYRLKQPGYQ